ncbi:hypothetical protein NDU88_008117 [Pleurodeles waltl]|uniref:Basic proline-rich protein-like n=1 Tax=Pleurodeles waltl TaxID=8319 RepID=A0AAV7VWD1_PLEWA|nr:hypothetical protein NDU88_008117 [Pleurodeles waltl]
MVPSVTRCAPTPRKGINLPSSVWPALGPMARVALPPRSPGPSDLWACRFSEALPGRAKAKQHGSLRPSSGPTRVGRGRVAPDPGKPPPAVRAPKCRRPPPPPPSAFSQQLGMTVPWGVPTGPGQHAPLHPPLRLRHSPAVSLPRRRPVPSGSRATGALWWGEKDGPRQACG